MTLTPIATDNPVALGEALLRRGLSSDRADAASVGLTAITFILDDVSADVKDVLSVAAHNQGVELLTGEDWVLLSGTVAKLGGLIRPGFSSLPEAIANEIGEFLREQIEPVRVWHTARGIIQLDRPLIVGILNVTPDSFSDGGLFVDPDVALRHAEKMIQEGAAMIDIGAESTRPGASGAVDEEEEWNRLRPVLDGFVRRFADVAVSVDTVKGAIARRALDAGAWVVNDVSGLRLDPTIGEHCASAGAGLVLMHSRGDVADMANYDHASYEDVTAEVIGELRESVRKAFGMGVSREQIVIDPGLGFSKRPEQNYEILGRLQALTGLGYPLMVGPSRKRFLESVTGHKVSECDADTAAVCVAAAIKGANLFRVHAVRQVAAALRICEAIVTA